MEVELLKDVIKRMTTYSIRPTCPQQSQITCSASPSGFSGQFLDDHPSILFWLGFALVLKRPLHNNRCDVISHKLEAGSPLRSEKKHTLMTVEAPPPAGGGSQPSATITPFQPMVGLPSAPKEHLSSR